MKPVLLLSPSFYRGQGSWGGGGMDTDSKSFAQDHIAQQWQRWVSELSSPAPASVILTKKHALISKTTE